MVMNLYGAGSSGLGTQTLDAAAVDPDLLKFYMLF